MSYTKEIGGYFELETGRAKQLHKDCIRLNSARNALRCIIKFYGFETVQVPYFTCPVVWRSLEAEGCTIIPYDLGEDFLPLYWEKDVPLIYTNYFGICNNNVKLLEKKAKQLILDNSQAYYAPSSGIGTFWSPRKFFGLPDGGILWSKDNYLPQLGTSQSWHRCLHLLKRCDCDAVSGYEDFQKSDASLNHEPPAFMSCLTRQLMTQIDYTQAAEKRRGNFIYLHQRLKDFNLIKVDLDQEIKSGAVPMVYPLRLHRSDNIREVLIKNKIYVATYWPIDTTSKCMTSDSALILSKEILPLPIDQRYDLDDMKRILDFVLSS